MTNINFENLFGVPARKPDEVVNSFIWMFASIQIVLEEIILKITKQISFEYKIKNLCLAGGVALKLCCKR